MMENFNDNLRWDVNRQQNKIKDKNWSQLYEKFGEI